MLNLSFKGTENRHVQGPPIDVSVVIPCHNYARFLPDSVSSALDQVHVNVEIIVVDDGSTDDLREVIELLADPRLTVIHQQQAGIGAARNAGIERARGSLVAFLDADDRWSPTRLSRAKSAIESSKQPLMAFAMLQEFLDPGIDTSTPHVPKVRTVKGISASSCVVSREVFDQVGPFDPQLESGEFIDWYVRAQEQGIETYIDPEILIFRRIHQSNRDRQGRDSSKEYARILMRKIQTQRGSNTEGK